VLIDRCLVPGGFFSEEGLARVTAGVVERLEQASPVMPASARKSRFDETLQPIPAAE
jgi:capsular polysaccharide export protein